MGRSPCCDEAGLTRGHWTPEEDKKLEDYILKHGHGHWKALPKLAGLNRCGKSCRLRWTNYLRPDIKRGPFSEKEKQQIIQLHSVFGNKWSAIAMKLHGRTDNEIKNYWNTHLRKKLLHMGIDPATHRPREDLTLMASIPSLLAYLGCGLPVTPLDNALRLQRDVAQLAKIQLIESLVQVLSGSSSGSSMSATNSLIGSGFLNNYTPPNDFQNLNQFQGLGESSTPGLHQVPTQTTPGRSLSSLGATNADLSHFLQNFSDLPLNSLEGNDMVPQINGSFPINDQFGFENNMSGTRSQMSSPHTNATSNSTPSIVSNSPENFSIDQMQELQYFQSTSSPNVADMCNDIFHWNDGL